LAQAHDKPGAHLSLVCLLATAATLGADAPAILNFTFQNSGARPAQVLAWGTPFEAAWFAPYVKVLRDGQPVRFDGAMIKRGDPRPDEYLTLAAGQAMRRSVNLAPAFDTRAPGRYRVEPQLWLHDVVWEDGLMPRPRAQHAGQRLSCNAVEFERTP
jgi:peptidyl-Lys metalloendopeptidase